MPGRTSNGLNASVETPCPIDKLPMRLGDKTMLVRLPQFSAGMKHTHTEIRRVHLHCVPRESPDYSRAVDKLTQTRG